MALSKSRPESVVKLEDCCSQAKIIQHEGAGAVLLREKKFPVARCGKLIETYPKRLVAIIATKGGSTKY